MIRYVVPAGGEAGMREYLEMWGLALADRIEILAYEDVVRRERHSPGTYVWSAMDQLGPALLAWAAALHDALAGDPAFRFVNHPTRTLGRYALLAALHAAGRNAFRAERATGDLSGLRFPVFLRAERTHDGAVSPLLHSRAEIDEALARAVLQGRRTRDLLVVEFCSTAALDGRYRKYAAYVVGDRVLARHLTVGREWMLKHRQGEYTWATVEEERAYVDENPHAEAIADVARIAGVGYGRIDYGVNADGLQTWEINTNPVIGRGLRPSSGRVPAELQPYRKETNARFYRAFATAWAAIDREGGDPVAVDLDPAVVRAARADRARPAQPAGRLVRWLEPARPMLEPVAARVLPFLGRIARRVR